MKLCLIVDDSPVIRKVARLIVEQLDFKVEEAEDADQAMKMCDNNMPDLILLDWHMPGMSAQDFLGAFSMKFPDQSPPILYCTTELDPKDIRMAFAGGITDFILKPYDRETLREKILNLPAVAA